MIECNFSSSESSKSIRFSGSEFQPVIETLNDSAGNSLFGPKPIEQKLPMRTKHPSHFLHGLNAGAHHAGAPKIEKFSGPEWGYVLPEELKILLEQITADCLQVVAKKITEFDFLLGCQILRSLQKTPAGMSKDGTQPFGLQVTSFLSPNLINCLVHMHDDMKPVQDMNGLAGFFGDDLEIRLPHIAADEEQLRRPLFAESSEKAQQGFDGSVLPHPQQSPAFTIDLVDDRQVLVTSLPENLIDADGPHVGQISMGQAPLNGPFHRVKDLLPCRAEGDRGFFPRKPFGPGSQKMHVGFCQRVFPVSPWHGFDLHATPGTVDPAHGINEKDSDSPQRNKLEQSWRQRVITGPSATATRANRAVVGTCKDFDVKRPFSIGLNPFDVSVNKALELLHPIQNSLQLHPGCFPRLEFLLAKKTTTGMGQDALCHSFAFSFNPFKRDNSPEPVGKWKSPAAFCGAFPLSHRLGVHGFIPINSTEEPIFPYTICVSSRKRELLYYVRRC